MDELQQKQAVEQATLRFAESQADRYGGKRHSPGWWQQYSAAIMRAGRDGLTQL
ncbi:MAG TPA: hypothetical protein VGO93_16540 [Candidatus Xenobia bacterium]|jgi:hypothetical protein